MPVNTRRPFQTRKIAAFQSSSRRKARRLRVGCSSRFQSMGRGQDMGAAAGQRDANDRYPFVMGRDELA